MKDFAEAMIMGLGVIASILLVAVLTGTIVWGTWDALHSFFPTAPLPTDPSWWLCVKATWLFSAVARIFLPNFEIKKKT